MSYTGNFKIKGLTPGYSDNRFVGNIVNSTTSMEASNAVISGLTCGSGSISSMTIGTGIFTSQSCTTLTCGTGIINTVKCLTVSSGLYGVTGGLYMGTYLFLNNFGESTYIGINAGGNLASAATYNTNPSDGNLVIGKNAFGSAANTNISSSGNTIIGSAAMNLASETGGVSSNSVVGCQALLNSRTVENNSGVGYGILSNLLTGNSNIAIGFTAGSAFTLNESSNICIGNGGVSGDSKITRIGTSNGVGSSKSFIQGIRGVTTDNNLSLIHI